MESARFKIIFEQLNALKDESLDEENVLLSDDLARELDEIEALRQIVLEIQNPQLTSYTTG
jgi:hypothetical protein